MEIVLMRHGEPEFSAQQGSARVKATDMSGWIAGYDASGVTGEPDCHAVLADKRRAFIISSPLPRARASLQAMNLTPDLIADDLHEAPLPVFNLPWLRLSPQAWLVLFRLCWLSGALAGPESKKQTMQRAEKMALTLIAHAQQHQAGDQGDAARRGAPRPWRALRAFLGAAEGVHDSTGSVALRASCCGGWR